MLQNGTLRAIGTPSEILNEPLLREVFGVTKKQRCWFHKTGLAMACKLMMSAQTKSRKLDGANRMLEIIQGIEFKDEIKQLQKAA